MTTAARLIALGDRFTGDKVTLRLVTMADCTERYVSWLKNPDVNRYLETRWSEQSIDSVKAFVSLVLNDPQNYLFAIVENAGGAHVGNLKIGPINDRHGHADISYFIGEPACWGRGYASEAIALATGVAFDRLGIRRLQAGLYEGNAGSAKALEKAGFKFEARFARQLKGPAGFEDHLWYVKFRDDGGMK